MPLSPEEKEFLDGLIEKSGSLDSPVLFLLHGIQDKYGRIKSEHADHLSEVLGKPLTEIYSAVTFYEEFGNEVRGKVIIRVCRGITCHSKGSAAILGNLKSRLGISEGQTTIDGKITLEEASCIGQCDGAPAIMINDRVYRNIDPTEAVKIVEKHIEKEGG